MMGVIITNVTNIPVIRQEPIVCLLHFHGFLFTCDMRTEFEFVVI